MARLVFALGIFTMASAAGVIGYQALTYYFYGDWPSVSFRFIVNEVYGSYPGADSHWANAVLSAIGAMPVALVGFVLSFLLLLVSDLLRGRATAALRSGD